VEWGLPEEKAQSYAEGLQRGGILIEVQSSDDRAEEARKVLCDAGAIDAQVRRAERQDAEEPGTGRSHLGSAAADDSGGSGELL
jgi:hypothetical protein